MIHPVAEDAGSLKLKNREIRASSRRLLRIKNRASRAWPSGVWCGRSWCLACCRCSLSTKYQRNNILAPLGGRPYLWFCWFQPAYWDSY